LIKLRNISDLCSVCGVGVEEGVQLGEHLHHCPHLQALSIENRDTNRKQIKQNSIILVSIISKI